MVLVAVIVVAIAKVRGLGKSKGQDTGLDDYRLRRRCGSIASLACTIGWMVWYENTTGYSAGNAPLGWIFFYGPASAAVGQLLALVVWWFRKPLIATNAA